VLVGLTGAKKISNLSPANPTRIIYGPSLLRMRGTVEGAHVAMRAHRGETAIALMRRICLKGAVAIVD
jgi:hypothetical protein